MKIRYYSLRGTTLLWYLNNLTNRKHRVICNKETSVEMNMSGDIPQVSTIGPLLFLNLYAP